MCGAMSSLIDVAIPEMAAGVLTYSIDVIPAVGSRVIVEVQKHLHTGFVLGETRNELAPDVEVKPVAGIIDDRLMTDPDIWDLAYWSGRVCMCGVNTALRTILPKNYYMGEKLDPPPDLPRHPKTFREVHNFNPFDTERVNFYAAELASGERTLMLLPTREAARDFYTSLPDSLKSEAVLWPFTKTWEVWQFVNSKKVRIVVGAPGAVFAPLCPDKIIIEHEADSGYFLPYGLSVSARSLAGRRAAFLGATLILGGRMPSLKTYMRTLPKQDTKPDRKNIILADIYASRKEESPGIEGNIPLTFSLIRRTYTELLRGNNVVWILNRQGEAQEVYCQGCGHVLKCEKCGSVMRSINDGNMLKCRLCGSLRELPQKCPECGRVFFRGRRPGLEALAKIITPYYPKVRLYVKGARKSSMRGLVLSTNRVIEILGDIKPSLVAWLDWDAELRDDDYDSRYRAFSRLYESYYTGRESDSTRKVLVQSRREGRRLAEYFASGWMTFCDEELRQREEFMLPPCGYMIALDTRGKIPRETLIDSLEDNGLFVMDPGDESQPVFVNVQSLDEVMQTIEPYAQKLTITVRSE